MRGPIVVGTDGSETSRLAIEEAATIAAGTGQSVRVVFVRHLALTGWSAMATGGQGVGAVQEALTADEVLAEAQAVAIMAGAVGVAWQFEVRVGEPAAELMRAAEDVDADTIVVAGRHHGAIGGLAHGSIGHQLLHRWPRTLLVIHPRSPGSSEPDASERPGSGR